MKLVLEPIVEADFQPVSYGFRPMRRAHDAIHRDRPIRALKDKIRALTSRTS